MTRIARLMQRVRAPSILLGSGLALCATVFAAGDALRADHGLSEAETLLWIGVESPRDASLGMSFTRHDALVRDVHELASESAYLLASGAVTTPEGTEGVTLVRTGGRFFDVLRVRPIVGRLLTEGDDHAGAERVVVISDSLWVRLFGADASAVGRILRIDNVDFRIVGVVPRDQSFPAATDAWVSLEATAGALLRSSDAPFLLAIARLRTREALQMARARLAARWTITSADPNTRLVVEPLVEHLAKGSRMAIMLFGAAAAFLMAISVVGAVTLQLAALTERTRDAAIRLALGAPRDRLIRVALREAGEIVLGTTVVGLVLSEVMLAGGRRFGGPAAPELASVRLSPAVFGVAIALAGFVAAVVAAVPLSVLKRAGAESVLRRSSHGLTTGQPGARLRDALTGIAVGLAVVLLIGAATSAATLLRLERVDMGFVAADVWASTFRLPMQAVTPADAERIRTFLGGISTALATQANRATIAISTDMPGGGNQSIVAVSAGSQAFDAQVQVGMSQISGEFFACLRIPLRRGRAFQPEDRSGSRHAVIVDEEVARILYGSNDAAVGRLLDIESLGMRAEIVGVASAVRQRGRFGEQLPQIYLPVEQLPLSRMTILLRSADGRIPLRTDAYQRLVHAVYPSATATALAPLESAVAELRRPRFYSVALATVAVVALVVAAGAVHASVAALVARRIRELGLRVALGASTSRIVGLVLARAGMSLLAGSAAGAVAGMGLIGALATRIALDRPSALTLAVGVGILWVAAGLAVLRPIARATDINPMLILSE
ncbi:MAG: ABC transporter permease [Gemmatimonadota bacterium]|nr:ABC transporter permease [Gemmatimonadota bacterium]